MKYLRDNKIIYLELAFNVYTLPFCNAFLLRREIYISFLLYIMQSIICV